MIRRIGRPARARARSVAERNGVWDDQTYDLHVRGGAPGRAGNRIDLGGGNISARQPRRSSRDPWADPTDAFDRNV